MFTIDWQAIFALSVPIPEIILRGTVVYLALFVLLRMTFRRFGGSIGLAEVLMIALVAAASQNAIAREHHSVTDGLILIATVAFWSYALDWVGTRSTRFQRFYSPPPLPLVKDGELLRRNMRLELITEEELMSYLRRAGFNRLEEVEVAYMEGDGTISAVRRKE